MGIWGPEDNSLWLNRPLGYWEIQLMQENPPAPGPRRANLNEIFHLEIKPGYDIDTEKFKEAVRVTVYNEPHLRARVDLKSDPIKWIPATKFDGVFRFLESNQGEAGGGAAEVWNQIEEEGNVPWDLDSENPLYKCILMKVSDGYIVMNHYHHSVGDGSSGLYIMNNILTNYNLLLVGKEPPMDPLPLRGPTEEETHLDGEEEMCQKMVQRWIDRASFKECFVPLDQEENKINDQKSLPLLKTLFHEGRESNLQQMRSRCKREKTTIGALATAAHCFGLCVLEAKKCQNEGRIFSGIRNHFTDIPVNIRQRVEPPLGPRVGFYVTELFVKTEVDLETNLWDLARQFGDDFKKQQEEKRHLLFMQVKKEFEMGATAEVAASLGLPTWNPRTMSVVSNIGPYTGPKDFPWGKLKAIHCTGFLVPFLLLLQSTDIMCYNLTYVPGINNEKITRRLLNVIIGLMENAGDDAKKGDLQSVLDQFL